MRTWAGPIYKDTMQTYSEPVRSEFMDPYPKKLQSYELIESGLGIGHWLTRLLAIKLPGDMASIMDREIRLSLSYPSTINTLLVCLERSKILNLDSWDWETNFSLSEQIWNTTDLSLFYRVDANEFNTQPNKR